MKANAGNKTPLMSRLCQCVIRLMQELFREPASAGAHGGPPFSAFQRGDGNRIGKACLARLSKKRQARSAAVSIAPRPSRIVSASLAQP
jgi:hypothetical protein